MQVLSKPQEAAALRDKLLGIYQRMIKPEPEGLGYQPEALLTQTQSILT
jgi:hypothetical protein